MIYSSFNTLHISTSSLIGVSHSRNFDISLLSSSGLLLYRLPLLVLDQICEYLAKCDDRHRHSLSSFSLASRRCYSTAASHLFERMKLTLNDVGNISRAVDVSKEILYHDRLRYVRHLNICDTGGMHYDVWAYNLEKEDAHYGDDGKGGPSFRESVATSYLTRLDQGRKEPLEEKYGHNQRWLPLARFFESLPEPYEYYVDTW